MKTIKYIGQPFFDILHDIGIDKKHFEEIEEIYFRGTMKESEKIKLYEGVDELLKSLQAEDKKLYIILKAN